MRPGQGYLFKLPAFMIELLALPGPAEISVEGLSLPIIPPERQYRRANEQTSVAAADPFSVDPAVVERAHRGHAATQNLLADHLTSLGLRPFSAYGPQPVFDLGWEDGDCVWIAEVKSITDANEEKQLRLGLGQILRYRQLLLGQFQRIRAALITEREPRDKTWHALCDALDIAIAWPGAWNRLPRMK